MCTFFGKEHVHFFWKVHMHIFWERACALFWKVHVHIFRKDHVKIFSERSCAYFRKNPVHIYSCPVSKTQGVWVYERTNLFSVRSCVHDFRNSFVCPE